MASAMLYLSIHMLFLCFT